MIISWVHTAFAVSFIVVSSIGMLVFLFLSLVFFDKERYIEGSIFSILAVLCIGFVGGTWSYLFG